MTPSVLISLKVSHSHRAMIGLDNGWIPKKNIRLLSSILKATERYRGKVEAGFRQGSMFTTTREVQYHLSYSSSNHQIEWELCIKNMWNRKFWKKLNWLVATISFIWRLVDMPVISNLSSLQLSLITMLHCWEMFLKSWISSSMFLLCERPQKLPHKKHYPTSVRAIWSNSFRPITVAKPGYLFG